MLFYEQFRKGKNVNPFHKYKSVPGDEEWCEETQSYITINERVDTNTPLFKQIKLSVEEVERKYIMR